MTKKLASIFVATCATFVLVFSAVGIWIGTGGDKSDPTQANSLSDITLAMLPSEYTVVVNKTTSGEESYVLQKGRIYKFEAWGAKGGGGGNGNSGVSAGGGLGGYGSYAVGWYDMRSGAAVAVSIFSGGAGNNGASSGSAGWSATQYSAQFQGTKGGGTGGGTNGGGGGGASGVVVEGTPILIAGGGGGGGGNGFAGGGGAGGGANGAACVNTAGGGGATQSAHGAGGSGEASNGASGTASGGGAGVGGGGGGAGGGYKRGFAGGGGGAYYPVAYDYEIIYSAAAGGGSGGTSYIGGVFSLSDSAASTTWANNNGVGRVQITEYVMGSNVAAPNSGMGYTVSAPSDTSVNPGGSYTFTVTREIGVGHIGLKLNTTNGTLELTSTNGNVFTYTVSNVQGLITAEDFSVTIYNVESPLEGTGYTVSVPSQTNVLIGGLYNFTVTLYAGYVCPIIGFNTGNGKLTLTSVNNNVFKYTISNVVNEITADDFSIFVSLV